MEEMSAEEMVEWKKLQDGQESGDLDRNVRGQVLHGCDLAHRLQSVVNSAEGQDLRQFTVEFCPEIVACQQEPAKRVPEDPRFPAPPKKFKGPTTFKNKQLLLRCSRRVPANAPQSAIDLPPEDGYTWRKCGQKDIFGAQYSRSYYRCTHRNDMGCQATKQVQRTKENPACFDVNYRGLHSCCIDRRLLQTPIPSSMPQIDSSIPEALFFRANNNFSSEASGVHGSCAIQSEHEPAQQRQ